MLDPLRGDPRFEKLGESLSLSEVEWVHTFLIDWAFVATGLWPVHEQLRLTEPWLQQEIARLRSK